MGVDRVEKGNLVQDIVSIEVEADRVVEQAREEAAAILKKAQAQAADVLGGVDETIKVEFEKSGTHYARVLEAERGSLEEGHKDTLQRLAAVDEGKRKALIEDIVKRVVEG